MQINKRISRNMSLTAIAAATSLLAACGGGGSSNASSKTVQGVVADSVFVPGSATDPQFLLTVYKNAKVCVDANNNGQCDSSENPVTTDSNGTFSLSVSSGSALIADIGTNAVSIVDSKPVAKRTVFRV
ncbi:MAG TPA: phosphoesterase, partial [Herminiimonas sp.]|nr:phosphoesterase [Herminiimonas sp.]